MQLNLDIKQLKRVYCLILSVRVCVQLAPLDNPRHTVVPVLHPLPVDSTHSRPIGAHEAGAKAYSDDIDERDVPLAVLLEGV